MAIANRDKYLKVKQLVANGVVSPSVVMQEITEVKNWRTAKKYVDKAIQELGDDQHDKKARFKSSVTCVERLKSRVFQKALTVKNTNQQIGYIKQYVKLEELYRKQLGFKDGYNNERDQASIVILRKEAEDKLREQGLI